MKPAALVLALALALAGCGGGDTEANVVVANEAAASLPQIPAPNGGNWTQVVNLTPEGGHRLGNPDAPVRLVEYGSLTCPVCGAFSVQATAPLTETYVRSGQVSWEFRHLLVHGAPDLALALLSNCMPAEAFFPTIEQIYSQQQEIVARLDQAEMQRIQALPENERLLPLAQAMELDGFFARRGMPESRFDHCLTDETAMRQLAETSERALNRENIRGTPTFFINGEQQDITSWNALQPRLDAALGR